MKKFVKGLFAAGLALSLAACSSNSVSSDDSSADDANASSDELTVIKVGATTTPHGQILEEAKEAMKEKGYDLQITEFSDYPPINPAVSDGSLDANYFQHLPYLEGYDADSNYKSGDDGYLISVGAIHYEPFGVYSETLKDVAEIKDGDKIAVPNDATNEARALLLLQELGLLTLSEDADLNTATIKDITENPKNLEIIELPADQIAAQLPDLAAGVINGNYAMAGDVTDLRIAYEPEDSDAAKTYQNIIAVKESNKDNEGIKTLVEVLKSDEIKNYITENFGTSVVPAE
ncbi:MetQ/NlpA family ABC transporter substrate-binding protein [Ileibacterium valens]|uniref:Lipoprotein n=1 Tax=Ileibacterium valens TaxID=1862668 RepID=A0A1U7NG71_9FIRM|nr:MetQ/NlpA family ABC transporter substrate-binding protein [Ileibacterium valens]OLU38703.1 metal ABC transporter substrate-binding protein [Erysipelotrichaceae bacterium NYU-BL-F16]OLU39902.1 metal ABC transporter substrate-binding protein [Ileibacterium valens]OLU41502.1 metal ABC transporter substrate-binding protein [Erysipelotrichaceae bacterium NYU-BL-E8]